MTGMRMGTPTGMRMGTATEQQQNIYLIQGNLIRNDRYARPCGKPAVDTTAQEVT